MPYIHKELKFKLSYEKNLNFICIQIIRGLYDPRYDLFNIQLADGQHTVSARRAAKFLINRKTSWNLLLLVKACQNKYEN